MSSISDNDDGINSLPDGVLCHILSFLPTKEVLATSLLSKRWKDLWLSVQAIEFYDLSVETREADFRMTELAYSFLLSVNSIKSCKLYIWYDDPLLGHLAYPNVIEWIDAVVQRGVEYIELCIRISESGCLKSPISILTCRTLVVLDLYGFVVKDFSSITLPSLKTLHLREITFLKVQDFLLLLAGCPNLEDLLAWYLEFLSQEFLTYQERESLTLSKLTKAILANTICHFPLKALRNVQHLVVDDINKVCQSCDEIPTFHNLTNLKLYCLNYNWNLLVQVLKQCPNLQNVELRQDTYNEMIEDVKGSWVDPTSVPHCLSLQLKTCKLLKFSGQEGEYLLARYILKNARVLQTMTIHCRKDLKIERELCLCPKASPICEVIVKREHNFFC